MLLVAGAWRDDLAIHRNMGVAQAEVLSAGPRRSTIEFVTPERVTYRPELGVLYPSELATGMRIYVEYNKKDPNLVRVQHRNAGLAIIPAGSIAVVAWLAATIALVGLALLDRRLDRRAAAECGPRVEALSSRFRVPYARRQPRRQAALTLWWCARCDRRRIVPPQCQRCQQLGGSGTRASASNRSRSSRHRPRQPAGRTPRRPLHDGIRVHRVPSRMFPKVTTLPLGVPMPRMFSVLRGFDPDVMHLASPALLGYGGLRAARRLGVPTVAVYQTDVPGFAASYGIPMTSRAAWAWFRHLHSLADRTLAPSTATMESLAAHRIPRVHRWARGVDVLRFAPSARDEALRRRWSPDGKPIVGFVGRLAPEKHVERLAGLAAGDAVQLVIVGDGVDRRQAAIGNAHSGFHRRAVWRGARRGVCQHGRLRASPVSTRRFARSCRKRWRRGCR